eukprot:TCONS_00058395-protein
MSTPQVTDLQMLSLISQLQTIINGAAEQLNMLQSRISGFDGTGKSLDSIPPGVPVSQITFVRQLFVHRAQSVANADTSDAGLGYWVNADGMLPSRPKPERRFYNNYRGRGRGSRGDG